ncbi:MAG: preprotein translocase subunit SecY [Clostridia bacterium]|nr:preprotein translocase subunit SecY [Clostridia bacterium]MDD4386403.1 preprotein translocase subunit SecY [Clostridia bacterium]
MLQTLKNIFSVKDLRKKIMFTVFIILLYRLGTFITVPGFDKVSFMNQIGSGAGILGTINLISGGAFSRFSIFAMTIGPYITASIVLNLLQMVIPSLEKLAREGEEGKKTLSKYTKYLTVAFALVEALGLYLSYKKFLLPSLTYGAGATLGALLFIGSLMAGTAILMWLGDKITEYGIGNGISIIIFVSIISAAPGGAVALYNSALGGITHLIVVIALILAMIAVIAGVIYMQQAERRIPVNYAKRVVGRKLYGGQSTHIPIKVAMAGVMPIIFAMSFMMFPSTIIGIITKNSPTGFWKVIYDVFSVSAGSAWYNLLIYSVLYMLLIIGFTFIYTMFIVNPIEIANTLKKNGGFVPGVRAGKNTSDYISTVLKYVTAVGAVFLAAVAVLPILLQGATTVSITFGGTSVLIIVSVALEILKNLETQMVSRHYKGFLD